MKKILLCLGLVTMSYSVQALEVPPTKVPPPPGPAPKITVPEQIALRKTKVKREAFPTTVSPEYRRIMILIDQYFRELGPGALNSALLNALVQQMSPILLTNGLLITFLRLKNINFGSTKTPTGTTFSRQSELKDIVQNLAKKKEAMQKTEKIAQTWVEMVPGNDDMMPLALSSQIPFDNDHWYVLREVTSNLLLLLPKKYLKALLGYDELKFTPEEDREIGFKLRSFERIMLPDGHDSPEVALGKFEDIIQKIQSEPFSENSMNFSKIFITKNEIPDLDYSWNVYASGHGKPGIVINISLDAFGRLLQFFNEDVNTHLLFYNSCYGGMEEHLAKPYKFSDKPGRALQYIVASGATTDALATADWSPKLEIINDILTPHFELNFAEFFYNIEQHKPFKTILASIAETAIARGGADVPIIRFKGANWFSAIEVNDRVEIITKVKVMKYLIEKRSMLIKDKDVVVIYPAVVPIFIGVQGRTPDFILMAPDTYIDKLFSPEFHELDRSFEQLYAIRRCVYIEQLIASDTQQQKVTLCISKQKKKPRVDVFVGEEVFQEELYSAQAKLEKRVDETTKDKWETMREQAQELKEKAEKLRGTLVRETLSF